MVRATRALTVGGRTGATACLGTARVCEWLPPWRVLMLLPHLPLPAYLLS